MEACRELAALCWEKLLAISAMSFYFFLLLHTLHSSQLLSYPLLVHPGNITAIKRWQQACKLLELDEWLMKTMKCMRRCSNIFIYLSVVILYASSWPPMSMHFGDSRKEKLPLTGRNLEQNEAHGRAAICHDRLGLKEGRQDKDTSLLISKRSPTNRSFWLLTAEEHQRRH